MAGPDACNGTAASPLTTPSPDASSTSGGLATTGDDDTSSCTPAPITTTHQSPNCDALKRSRSTFVTSLPLLHSLRFWLAVSSFAVLLAAAAVKLSPSLAAVSIDDRTCSQRFSQLVGDSRFSVVFDAGSTGTRVHVFEFAAANESAKNSSVAYGHKQHGNRSTAALDFANGVVLRSEFFHHVKPGLSSHHTRPDGARAGLQELLAAAKGHIQRLIDAHLAASNAAAGRQSFPSASESLDASRAAAERLRDLLRCMPVALKATAGFRLLPTAKATALFRVVEDELRIAGFSPKRMEVGMLSGTDEGTNAWLTVKFLLRQQQQQQQRQNGHTDHGHHHGRRLVTLDMGGASTQIVVDDGSSSGQSSTDGRQALEPQSQLPRATLPSGYSLYSHSHLGLGLMQARKQMMQRGQLLGGSAFFPCFRGGYRYVFEGVVGMGGGEDGQAASYEQCRALAVAVVNASISSSPSSTGANSNGGGQLLCSSSRSSPEGWCGPNGVPLPPALKHRPDSFEIVVFSYFFDRMLAFLPSAAKTASSHNGEPTTEGDLGAIVPVSAFGNAARAACDMPSTKRKGRAAVGDGKHCMDLSYLHALLTVGYGLQPDTRVHVLKKINGREASWALGLALRRLQA